MKTTKITPEREEAYWQEVLTDMLGEVERREHSFPTIDRHGRITMPVQNANGIVTSGNLVPNLKGYKGLALEVNDHGNVTLWNCYKNGRMKEIASRV